MSMTVTMEEAQAKLPELLAQLAGGEEVIITLDRKPIAKIVKEKPVTRQPRSPGNCQGMATIRQDDEDHLQDFEEYM